MQQYNLAKNDHQVSTSENVQLNIKDTFTLGDCVCVCDCFLSCLLAFNVNNAIEINGIHLVADAIANADAQCEWVLNMKLINIRTMYFQLPTYVLHSFLFLNCSLHSPINNNLRLKCSEHAIFSTSLFQIEKLHLLMKTKQPALNEHKLCGDSSA